MAQLDLFDMPELAPQAARLAPKLHGLAEKGVYWGTSSWKYEGWVGQIYSQGQYLTRGKFSASKFERECLSEYARTFPTVCGDFAFYQFPSESYWSKIFDALPEGFKLGLKVPEDITVTRWPSHARYGTKAGAVNEHFLDATIFRNLFASRLRPHKDKLGPLIFEFGQFARMDFAQPEDFIEVLGMFLGKLPRGFRYAVEIRNETYLSPSFFKVLAEHNVAYAYNAWTRMPTLADQAALPDSDTADFVVVRALLARGRNYEAAVKAFEPYDRTQEKNESAREGLFEIARQAMLRKKHAYLFVNNRLEGNAPNTIEAVVNRL